VRLIALVTVVFEIGSCITLPPPPPVECPPCPPPERIVVTRPREKAMRYFGSCMAGPNQPIVGDVEYVPCTWLVDCLDELDADGDGDVDLRDFALISNGMREQTRRINDER